MAEKEFIERTRLIGKLEKGEKLFKKSGHHRIAYVFLALKREVERMPADYSATIQHGFWSKETLPFKDKQGNQHFGACCSNCGAILDRTKFCGECGAKMDEEADNE